MKFVETKLQGVVLVDIDCLQDERGFFARTVCSKEFAAHGLSAAFVQSSVSYNRAQGTLRGMHYQRAPYEEKKIVRCVRGAIYDVVLDLRPQSPTFRKWIAVELNEDNARAVYIPEGCAHGFQTLTNDTVILYQMTAFFDASSAAGVRWDDPVFGISWPDIKVRVIADKDRQYPDFTL